MLEIATALGRRILPALCAEAPVREGVRTWLSAGSFYVDPASSSETILIRNATLSDIVPYISYDFERLVLASAESVSQCQPNPHLPKSLGWPLLKLYYAAFFAAHSIMRATGGGILRVEPAQARQLADLATLYGANIGVTAGTFEMRLSQLDDRSLGVKLTRISEGGGAHDQLWRRFNAFLSNVSDEAVQNSEPAASDIARDVMELQSVMQSNGLTAGTWLSSVRNQINYQQQHGVWFPYGASAPVVQAVRRLSIRETESIRRDYNPSKEPILAFGSTCHLIVSIASQLAVSAASRIKSRRFSGLWRRVNSTPNKTPS